MQKLADKYKSSKPKLVMTVLNRTLPMIEKKIENLENIDDEYSMYSENLDDIEK